MKIVIDTKTTELVEKIIDVLQKYGAFDLALSDKHIYPPSGMWGEEIDWQDAKENDGTIPFITGNDACMEEENRHFVELLMNYKNAKDEIDLLTKQRNRLTEDCVRLGMENKKLKDQKKDEIVIDDTKIAIWTSGLGFNVHWRSADWGFGVLCSDVEDGKLIIETECMGKEFVQAVFAKLLEDAVYVNNYEDDN